MKLIKYAIIFIIFTFLYAFFVNYYVVSTTKSNVLIEEEISKKNDINCILILGAGVWGENPSPMLKDRLDRGIKLYKDGLAPKIIMSGDHGQNNYDEVNIMKKYAIDNGVPSEDIFMDHAGFSTYDSIYRAKKIFKAKRVIIVTQKYHLYRALYISKKLGLDAYGIEAVFNSYSGAEYREFREVLARNKDFVKCIFKPKSTYLGEEIPVSGNGDITND